jgi:hypothetical protein
MVLTKHNSTVHDFRRPYLFSAARARPPKISSYFRQWSLATEITFIFGGHWHSRQKQAYFRRPGLATENKVIKNRPDSSLLSISLHARRLVSSPLHVVVARSRPPPPHAPPRHAPVQRASPGHAACATPSRAARACRLAAPQAPRSSSAPVDLGSIKVIFLLILFCIFGGLLFNCRRN